MHNSVQFITITSEKAGQRIDNFLITYLKGVPRSRIYRLVRSGELRVNKKRVDVSYRLQAEDIVRLPPIRLASTTEPLKASANLMQTLESRILYDDDDLLILNKPAGIAVHGGSGISLGVIETLRQLYPKKNLELVHRLDRDTSGCLMIAKKNSALRELHQAMRAHEISKSYLLLVKGHWPKRLQRIDQPLHKNQLQSGERMVFVADHGKPACTHFQLQTCFAETSLVQARLETGRTHQIRVHATFAQHPLAGDEKYGNKEFNQYMRGFGLRRLFLHASELKLRLPRETQLVSFSAPLDENLMNVLESLK